MKKWLIGIPFLIVVVAGIVVFFNFFAPSIRITAPEAEESEEPEPDAVVDFSYYQPQADLEAHSSQEFNTVSDPMRELIPELMERNADITRFPQVAEFLPYGMGRNLVPWDFSLGEMEDLVEAPRFYAGMVETVREFSAGFLSGTLPEDRILDEWEPSVARSLSPFMGTMDEDFQLRLGRITESGDRAEAYILFRKSERRISGEIYLMRTDAGWEVEGITLVEESSAENSASFEPFAYSGFTGY